MDTAQEKVPLVQGNSPVYPNYPQWNQPTQQFPVVNLPPAYQNVVYVYAPQGAYPIPGNPSLLAVPNGLAMQPVLNQPMPQVMHEHSSTPLECHVRKLAMASLITYILGLFLFLPHIASIAISFHMAHKRYTEKRRDAILAFTILELIGWVFVVTFGWYYQYDCTNRHCYVEWLGWIAIVVWFAFSIAFGIPRVIYTMQYDAVQKCGCGQMSAEMIASNNSPNSGRL